MSEIQEQLFIFHDFFGLRTFEDLILFGYKVYVLVGKCRGAISRGKDWWDRFQRRLNQTPEEAVVILSSSWQLKASSHSPSFWILERPGWRLILSLQAFPQVSVPFSTAATAQRCFSCCREERKSRRAGEKDPVSTCDWAADSYVQHLPHSWPSCAGLCTFLWSAIYLPPESE